MKQIFRLLTLALAMFLTVAASATVSTLDPAAGVKKQELTKLYDVHLSDKVTVNDVLTMSVKEVEAKWGKKMTWKEKGAFKLAKYRFTKAAKKSKLDAAVGKSSDGSFGIGFLLGFALGLIGILVAYLAFKDESKTIKGAWWGLGAWLLIILLYIILIAAATTSV